MWWLSVVEVEAVLYFQHRQSCRIHLRWWCWHVELAMRVGGPILLVVLEVKFQDG